jgi:hypothetical protein
MRLAAHGAIVLLAALPGCSATRRAPDPHETTAASAPHAAADPGNTPVAAPAARTPPPAAGAGTGPGTVSRCGATSCRVFADDRAAFAAALASAPALLAVGEAHAQRGSEVESSTRRFMRDLLPMVAGRATDIVIELMLPNPKCAPEGKKAQKEQKVVTEHQAETDQNDYVALGTRATALGIRPHALEPTCEDLARIAKAGPDVVTVSLDVVTRLATETLSKLLSANAAPGGTHMVVAYGGLMHNDIVPLPERATWSFGPAMKKMTSDRYMELDLVAPEQIEDSSTWRALRWVPGFDRDAHPQNAVLLSPSPGSYVLVFPRSAPPVNASLGGTTTPVPSASPR